MQTRYSFPIEAINEFETRNNVSFDLSFDQIRSIDETGSSKLSLEQLLKVAEILAEHEDLGQYAKRKANHFGPFSMSLFVFNDAVWKMMEKKEESQDTMLPMATIPWFHWELVAISPGNPFGVRRDDILKSDILLDPMKSLTIFGVGGDFCGILEGQLADQKRGPRSLLAPVLPGPDNPVPRYEIEDIGVNVELGNLEKTLYPEPQKKIDYTFSEHPKIFYEHGLSILAPGSKFKLKVGRKKPTGLYGDVLLLIGKRWNADSNLADVVEYHVWLSALYRVIH